MGVKAFSGSVKIEKIINGLSNVCVCVFNDWTPSVACRYSVTDCFSC